MAALCVKDFFQDVIIGVYHLENTIAAWIDQYKQIDAGRIKNLIMEGEFDVVVQSLTVEQINDVMDWMADMKVINGIEIEKVDDQILQVIE